MGQMVVIFTAIMRLWGEGDSGYLGQSLRSL